MSGSFLFFFSLKSGAWFMAFTNLTFAIMFTAGSIVELYFQQSEENKLYFILGIIMGIYNLITGIMLVAAIVKGKERLVLLYLLLELSNLIIITIFAIFNIFEYKSFMLAGLFMICLVLWYGLYGMIGYYSEMAQFNSVKSGTIEITCNTHINPLVALPEKAIESTAV